MRRPTLFVVGCLTVLLALTGAGTGWAQTLTRGAEAGWLQGAVDREMSRLSVSRFPADSALHADRQSRPQKRSWIGRHPVLFGALVGSGGGFLIGYLPGDDAVFDDFTAEFNGLVLGGAGALAGAIVGGVTTRP